MSRLGPGDVPRIGQPVNVIHGDEEGMTDSERAEVEDLVEEMTAKLQKLREPFPADMIEKLPKPMYKGAWDGKRGSRCDICHGYHVLDDCIHLDYVGHANTTNRLLETDPFWEWEPMAYTEAGLPLFDKVGGLWIKLTVCGVTRLGYGDGSSPKEIIGDAIRNAAMRFGVALDLWSKIDLHAERNPGDGQTPTKPGKPGSDDTEHSDRQSAAGQPGQTRAPNQDALDSLGSVCDENGFDRRTMRDEYEKWATSKRYRDRDLLTAHRDRIYKFAEHLLEGAEPPVEPGQGGGAEGDAAEAVSEAGTELKPDVGPEGGPTGGDEAVLAEQVDGNDEAQSDPADMF